MQRRQLLIISLLLATFIVGCTGGKADSQSAKAGDQILNQDRITNIELVKGLSEEKTITLSDSTDISDLINMIKEIPVNRLTKSKDNNFMPKRVQDDSLLNIRFYTDDTSFDSLQGEFFIWPDGYIYTVDVNSMKGDQRTASYLSASKYPDIYDWLYDKL